jgi:hypothetical protein
MERNAKRRESIMFHPGNFRDPENSSDGGRIISLES